MKILLSEIRPAKTSADAFLLSLLVLSFMLSFDSLNESYLFRTVDYYQRLAIVFFYFPCDGNFFS